MLNQMSSVPLYLQIATKIGNDILSGKLQKGEQLMSEPKLSEYLNVSRVTLRRAIAELVERGFLIRKQGKGTYVSTSPFFASASAQQQSFSLSTMGMSITQTTKIIHKGIRSIDPKITAFWTESLPLSSTTTFQKILRAS